MKRLGVGVFSLVLTLGGLALGTNPAEARNTGPYPACGTEFVGNGLFVDVCDQSGSRQIKIQWHNVTGAQKCIAAYSWWSGWPTTIFASQAVNNDGWVAPSNWTASYSAWADATIQVKDCSPNGAVLWTYKVGAAANANGFI